MTTPDTSAGPSTPRTDDGRPEAGPPDPLSSPSRRQWLVARPAAFSAGLAATFALGGLAGHAFGVPWLVQPLAGLPVMRPVSAVVLLLLAVALLLLGAGRTAAARLLALLGGGAGMLLLVARPQFARLLELSAVNTAASFVLLSAALLLPTRDRRARLAAVLLTLAAGALPFVAVVGYLFDAVQLYQVQRDVGMAPFAAAALLLLAFATALQREPRLWHRLVTDPGPAMALLRRLLPVALLAPALLATIRLSGEEAGWWGRSAGLAYETALTSLALGVLALVIARAVAVAQAARAAAIRAEETRRAETYVAEVFAAGDEAIAILDRAGRVRTLNPRARALLDAIGVQAAAGDDGYAILVRLGHEAVVERMRQAVATREAWQGIRPGHGGRIYDLRVIPLADGTAVAARDVTARLAHEQAERARSAQLEFAAEGARLAWWNLDPVSGESIWSSRFFDLLGLDPETTRPGFEPWAARLHPGDRARVLAAIDRARATGERYEAEYRILRGADGAERWIRSLGALVTVSDGVQRFVGVSSDVTDARAAAAERERQRALFDAAMLGTPDVVGAKDLQGRYLFLNDEGAAYLGIPAASVVGRTDRELFPPEIADGIEASDREVLATNALCISEQQVSDARRDGEPRTMRTRKLPLRDAEGRVIGVAFTARDETEQLAAAAALRHSEAVVRRQLAELEAIYRDAPIGLAVLDREMRFVRINERLAEVNGVPVADHLGRTLREIVPAIAEQAEAAIRQVLETGESLRDVELTGETAAAPGEIRTWLEQWTPLRDDAGVILGVTVVVEEITERRERERDREFLLATALALQSPALADDPDTMLHEVLQRLGTHLGAMRTLAYALSDDLAVADVHSEWLRPDLPADWPRARGTYRMGEAVPDLVATHEAGDEWVIDDSLVDPRTAESAAAALLPLRARAALVVPSRSEGRLVGGLGVHHEQPHRWTAREVALVRDLTERCFPVIEAARARRRLAEEERRYRALVEASSQMVWRVDGARAAVTLDRTPFEAIAGSAWWTALHPEDRAATEAAWAASVSRRAPFEVECRIAQPAGVWRTVLLRAVPVAGDGDVVREWVGTGADVTERRRAEEQLRQMQRVQSVGRLAGGVAHEVNNQMTAVVGFGRLVIDALGVEHPQAEDVQLMVEAGERAAGIARQLLAFTRQQVLTMSPLDPSALADQSVRLFRRVLGEQYELTLELPPTVPAVRGDRAQLEQCLLNLALNARDAMPHGGALRFRISTLTVPEGGTVRDGVRMRGGAYVCFSVQDTGQGMDETTRSRALEPFFTTKPVGQGTGLGLSTVYGIVKQHRGYIWLRSAPGEGTTVEFMLPAAGQTVTPPPAPEAPAHPRDRRGTVLLVEDEPSVRLLARRALTDAGYQVVEAADGGAALALLSMPSLLPDLIVCDVVMPGMGGLALARGLRERGLALPVLYISGYPLSEVRERGWIAPDAPLVGKPFTPGELVRAVGALLPAGVVAR